MTELTKGTLLLCIDAKNRPNEIPESKWLEEDEIYTLEKPWWNPITKELMFQIKEIQLPPEYKGFAAWRLRPL